MSSHSDEFDDIESAKETERAGEIEGLGTTEGFGEADAEHAARAARTERAEDSNVPEQPTSQARPRTLFIDADACPVTREALDCARRTGVPVVIAGNTTQNLSRHLRTGDPRDAAHAKKGFWVDILDVSIGADSADFAIVEQLAADDVVVTQDIGLASMVLGRGAAAISVRGHIFRRETIDLELFIRHEEKKVRRAGGRTRGPAAFTSEDRRRFTSGLMALLRAESDGGR